MSETEELVIKMKEFSEKGDFEGLFNYIKANRSKIDGKLSPQGVKELLKRTTKDRDIISFVDGVEFGIRSMAESLVRLEKLLSFQKDSLVLSKAWGLGKVKRIDYFYRRITVDFKTNTGHQFTYSAAVEMLESAPEDHILVLRERDPAAFDALLKEKPADFVVQVLKSYGGMTITKLEDVCAANGFVKAVNWKKFWEAARVELKKDKHVVIPVKRNEPITVSDNIENYGEKWLTAFSHETDPKLILASVREYAAQNKLITADEQIKSCIAERLSFAVTAARKVDDALYARLACQINEFGFATPPAKEMREYLCERRRYVKAAVELPAREVGAMIEFLADSDEAKAKLYESIPDFCFTAVSEIINRFGGEVSCRNAVANLIKAPKAPATLITLLAGKWEQFKDWAELPPFIIVLTHAIALGEGRQSGEILKMQNIIRRLFINSDWLKKVFAWLSNEDAILFFERFQASIAWDPSTHHTIVVRMTHLKPELESHVVKVEKKKEYARITSMRSFAMKKTEYLKLINEDMPANVKRIEFAKSYGDLSENAEYQYAKDEQRALMQKQTLMQAELETVKAGDFADATTDEVMPGVTVVIATTAGEKVYTILGEWDNDLEQGIISSKTRVAENMMGKKVGDNFELPNIDGNAEFATIKEIKPLSAEIKEWMKIPEGMQI